MAKQGGSVLHFVAWFTGVVVSLVVGFGMVDGTLTLPAWLGGASVAGAFIVLVVGWIVVITTLISAILALMKS